MSQQAVAYNILRIDYKHHAPGWRFRAVRARNYYSKYFRDDDYGGRGGALKAALAYRDKALSDLPPGWCSQLPNPKRGVRLVYKKLRERIYTVIRVSVPQGVRGEKYGCFRDIYVSQTGNNVLQAFALGYKLRRELVDTARQKFGGRKHRNPTTKTNEQPPNPELLRA